MDPLEQLSRLDNNFNALNNKAASNQQSGKQKEPVGNYTLDEARDFIRKTLTHKWVDGNSRAGLQQHFSNRTKTPIAITRQLNANMDQFYLDLTQTQMMA